MFKLKLTTNEEKPFVAATTNGLNNRIENELAYQNENAFAFPNIDELEQESKICKPITVHCAGRKHEHSDDCGYWSVVTLNGEGDVLWEETGEFKSEREATDDDADYLAVRKGVLFASMEYPGITKVLTSSLQVAKWLTDESSPQNSEVYKDLYEHKAIGYYCIDLISREQNRAATSLDRAGSTAGGQKI